MYNVILSYKKSLIQINNVEQEKKLLMIDGIQRYQESTSYSDGVNTHCLRFTFTEMPFFDENGKERFDCLWITLVIDYAFQD